MNLVAHQKQFVLGPLPVAVRPDWPTIRIAEGLILSHCPKLRIQQLRSIDGVPYWLLGLAVRADEPMRSIPDGFCHMASTEIENWTGQWAGRWLLISADRCWQDASGCLGVYHRRVGDAFWISSSPALLGDHVPDAPAMGHLPWRVTHNKGIDWIPVPFTTREGIYKLLPLRTMELRTGRTAPVAFAAPAPAAGGEQPLVSALTAIMSNWAQAGFDERFVALTAGLDTRTILAAAVAAGIDVQAFTNRFSITLKRDLALPPRIAARARVPYTLHDLPPVEAVEAEARKAAMAEHMDGAAFHSFATEIATCKYNLMNDRGQTVAHGTSFEIGRCFFWHKLSNLGREAPPTDPDHILDSFAFHSSWRPEPVALWRQALESWIGSLADPVPLALDWRDRFYLDQRLGGWNSSWQRLWDVFDGTAFYPANCLRVFDLLLRFDPEKRKAGFAQREAIRRLAPELLKFPVNPNPVSKRLKATIRELLGPKAAHALKSLVVRQDPRRVRGIV